LLFSFRGQATHTSAVSLARTLGLTIQTVRPTDLPLSLDAANSRINLLQVELEKESDRAVAILGAAELDETLATILTAYLVPPSSTSKKYGFTLFGSDQPAGTLSAKIEVAFRIGLVPTWWQTEAHFIRRIRNEFAHQSVGYSFAASPVKELVDQLYVPKQMIAGAPKGTFPRNHWKKPRNHFIASTLVIVADLTTALGNVQDGHVSPLGRCERVISFYPNGD
jgi:DNA-binding MltR family transcriptional regulator